MPLTDASIHGFLDELTLIKEAGWKDLAKKHLLKNDVLIPSAALLGGIYLGRRSLKKKQQAEEADSYYGGYPQQRSGF